MLAYAFIAGGFFVTVMLFAMIYAVFVIGLNVFMGFTGQVSFGHNAFASSRWTAPNAYGSELSSTRSMLSN